MTVYFNNNTLVGCIRNRLIDAIKNKTDFVVWFGASTTYRLRVGQQENGYYQYKLDSYTIQVRNGTCRVVTCVTIGILASPDDVEELIHGVLGQEEATHTDWSIIYDVIMAARPDMTLVSSIGSVAAMVEHQIHHCMQKVLQSTERNIANLDELFYMLQHSKTLSYAPKVVAQCMLVVHAISGRAHPTAAISVDNVSNVLQQLIEELKYVSQVTHAVCKSEGTIQALLSMPPTLKELEWAINHASMHGMEFTASFITPGVGTVGYKWSFNDYDGITTWYKRVITQLPPYETQGMVKMLYQRAEIETTTTQASGSVPFVKMIRPDTLASYYVPGKTIVSPYIHAIVLAGRFNTHNMTPLVDRLVGAALEATSKFWHSIGTLSKCHFEPFVLGYSAVPSGSGTITVTENAAHNYILYEQVHECIVGSMDNQLLTEIVRSVYGMDAE